MFSRLLIANRGEIACRVIRTARRLGLTTIAVYSDADAGALHVEAADEARRIGPAAARDSYLSIDAVLAAARQARAEAIHPGYGFLAENPKFAEACAEAGLAFVGPPAAAMRALGAKDKARALMARAGVPIVPGDDGADQDAGALLAAARRIGFPVLLKPISGGGGKGMRVVASKAEFAGALAASRREAVAAFADDRVLIEKYLARPRHVEVQVFADAHGNAVHLFERDCSIQRRHQKVIEEAPAPGLALGLRRRLAEAAVAAARAAGYVGAGTVEFLVEGEAWYFLEMNTRLQVEHPVTEMVTGLDLVEWQLRIAAGEPLPLRQADVRLAGHAIEARLYAEDPERQFLPCTGTIAVLRLPQADRHVRVDSGIREGDAIGRHYDPMIAKLIVRDSSRTGAIRRLRSALAEVRVEGVATNVALLRAIAGLPAFAAADLDTRFIERHQAQLAQKREPVSEPLLALAALSVLVARAAAARAAAARSSDPHSPWHRTDCWRLGDGGRERLAFRDGDAMEDVGVEHRRAAYVLEFRGRRREAAAETDASGDLVVVLDGARFKGSVRRTGADLILGLGSESRRLRLHDWIAEAEARPPEHGSLIAPMPGAIAQVLVKPGQRVERGAPLVVLEAMKMEHVVAAPADGVVEAVHVAAGEQVADGVELLAFRSAERG